MLVLFVTGVMNVLWVTLLAIYVLVEKTLPRQTWIPRVAGVALIVWGLWLLAGMTR
jgi:predicted metal-binding membrane protein